MQVEITLRGYNKLIKRAAVEHSMCFGIDTLKARRKQARLMRKVRREYPFSQYGVTWGINL